MEPATALRAVIGRDGSVKIVRPSNQVSVGHQEQAKRFFISGIVQGVGFRFFAQRLAEPLEIAGYTRNLRDGRVEVYAIGSPQALREFRAKLERGPISASVSAVTEHVAELDSNFSKGFSIEYDC